MTAKTFKLSPEDLAAYQFAVRDRLSALPPRAWWESDGIRAAALLVLFVIAVMVIDRTLQTAFGRSMELPDFLIGAGAGAALVLGLVWMSYRDQRRRIVREEGVILGEHTLELTVAGVVSRQRHVEARYDWPVILEVTDQRGMVILWIEPGVGIAVPQHAFASDAERTQFVAEVEQRRTGSQLPRVGSFG
jgi:hypothetical protein